MLCLNCEGDLSKLKDSPRVFICGDCYDIIKKLNLNFDIIGSLK